ncbi:MAG: hypothetical protein PUB34_07255, partial [Clostridia bacterium]|nr:hypothetical protein [Clostridia bacterium]
VFINLYGLPFKVQATVSAKHNKADYPTRVAERRRATRSGSPDRRLVACLVVIIRQGSVSEV